MDDKRFALQKHLLAAIQDADQNYDKRYGLVLDAWQKPIVLGYQLDFVMIPASLSGQSPTLSCLLGRYLGTFRNIRKPVMATAPRRNMSVSDSFSRATEDTLP